MSHASKSSEMDQVIIDAKILLGKETSDLNFKTILNNELSNNSPYFKRLVKSEHPFMKTIRRLANDEHHTRGMTILLLAQALYGEVSSKHRKLAEIVEIVAAAQVTHEDVEATGGKLAVLAGDFLLATACRTLCMLHSSEVVRLISVAISEQNQAEFLGDQQTGLVRVDDWERLNFLRCGSLMANSCKAVVALEPQCSQRDSKLAYDLGRDLAYAWQLHQELQPFLINSKAEEVPEFDINYLPVLMHLHAHPEDFTSPELADLARIYKAVCSGDVLEKCRVLLEVYIKKALSHTEQLPPSVAAEHISKLLRAMKE